MENEKIYIVWDENESDSTILGIFSNEAKAQIAIGDFVENEYTLEERERFAETYGFDNMEDFINSLKGENGYLYNKDFFFWIECREVK